MNVKLLSYVLVDQLTEKKMISLRRLKLEIFKTFFIPKEQLEKLHAFIEVMRDRNKNGLFLPLAIIFEYFLATIDFKNYVVEHIEESRKRSELKPPVFLIKFRNITKPQNSVDDSYLAYVMWFQKHNGENYIFESWRMVSNNQLGEPVFQDKHFKSSFRGFKKMLKGYASRCPLKYIHGVYYW